jgi:hypothetical protein
LLPRVTIEKQDSAGSANAYESDSSEQDLNFYDQIDSHRAANPTIIASRLQDANCHVQFKDFLEPHVIKTGHLIPVSAGHNGCLS